MKRKPRRRSSTISRTTRPTPRCRGSWPSVRHTEQNEQCFGQPRTVCTDAHMYRSLGGDPIARAGTFAATFVRRHSGDSVTRDGNRRAPAATRDRRRRGRRRARRRVRGPRRGRASRGCRRRRPSRPARGRAPDLVAAKRVGGVNADADDVARRDVLRDHMFDASRRRGAARPIGSRRRGKDVQPPRGDDGNAEGELARVHEMDGHRAPLQRARPGPGRTKTSERHCG